MVLVTNWRGTALKTVSNFNHVVTIHSYNPEIPLRIKAVMEENHTVEWYGLNADQKQCLWNNLDIDAVFGKFRHNSFKQPLKSNWNRR